MASKDLIIIGSPRGKGSNSWFLAQIFIEGLKSFKEWTPNIIFLSNKKSIEEHAEAFKNSERILWFFPLYTDAMPALVKNFMEHLKREDFKNKEFGYFIISGFPEAHHNIYIERYFINLTQKYEGKLIGSVIKGGMEGIMIQPKWATRKVRKKVFLLGNHFAKTGVFDKEIIEEMRKMMQLPKTAKVIVPILKKIGWIDGYWNKNLKKNKAYNQRCDKPYLEK